MTAFLSVSMISCHSCDQRPDACSGLKVFFFNAPAVYLIIFKFVVQNIGCVVSPTVLALFRVYQSLFWVIFSVSPCSCHLGVCGGGHCGSGLGFCLLHQVSMSTRNPTNCRRNLGFVVLLLSKVEDFIETSLKTTHPLISWHLRH